MYELQKERIWMRFNPFLRPREAGLILRIAQSKKEDSPLVMDAREKKIFWKLVKKGRIKLVVYKDPFKEFPNERSVMTKQVSSNKDE